MGLVTVVTGMAVPSLLGGVDRARGGAAARYLAARLSLARAQAVSRSVVMALRFEEQQGDVAFTVYEDGNGDGVRARDIERGADVAVEPRVSLSALFPGVSIGVAGDTTDGVQIGRTTILSFTPSGTATSGTIHLHGRDGTQWAVRVLGATGRTRVLRYVPTSGQWVETL